MEKSASAWKEFTNIKQRSNESSKEYVSRFEWTETKIRNKDIKMPNKALALHIIMKSSMGNQSKENILVKVDLDDNEEIYASVKKSMKEMKSKVTARHEGEENIVQRESNKKRTYIGSRERYGNSKFRRGRSRNREEWKRRNGHSGSRS